MLMQGPKQKFDHAALLTQSTLLLHETGGGGVQTVVGAGVAEGQTAVGRPSSGFLAFTQTPTCSLPSHLH